MQKTSFGSLYVGARFKVSPRIVKVLSRASSILMFSEEMITCK